MEVTSTFREAVKTQNVRKVRNRMCDSILIDPDFKLFKEMEKIALESMGEDVLYDEHDGQEFRQDESTWDDDYMNDLMLRAAAARRNTNFSRERLEHLKEVVNKLHPLTDEEREYRDAQKKAKQQKQTGVGAAAGAVAGGIVAVVVDAPVAAGVLAGAVIAGAATYIYTGKE